MWVLPSLNRPGRLATALAAIRSVGVSTPGIVILGPDQIEDRDRLVHVLPDGWEIGCQNPDDRSLGEVMNRFFREVPDLAWYGLLQDDVIVKTAGWDTELIRTAGPCGMASCDDGFVAPQRIAGAMLFGGDFLRAMGFWSLPGAAHCFQDDLWEEVGRQCDIWRVRMDIRAEHVNIFNGRADADATYEHGYAHVAADRAIWEAYKASPEYTDLIRRVKALSTNVDAIDPALYGERLAIARSRSVMICTPIARDPTWQYTMSMLKTFRTLDSLGIRCDAKFVIGNSNLPKARNELVADFLASDFTDMIFIDDDMGWSADAIVRLLASEHPLIGVVGRKRCANPNSDPAVWCVRWLPGEVEQDGFGAIKVAGVGTGVLRIHRSVLETMIDAHPDWKRAGPGRMSEAEKAMYYAFFRFTDDGHHERGEDMDFCGRWIDLGGEVYIDPEIELTHVGSKEYRGKVTEVLLRKPHTLQAAG